MAGLWAAAVPGLQPPSGSIWKPGAHRDGSAALAIGLGHRHWPLSGSKLECSPHLALISLSLNADVPGTAGAGGLGVAVLGWGPDTGALCVAETGLHSFWVRSLSFISLASGWTWHFLPQTLGCLCDLPYPVTPELHLFPGKESPSQGVL